MPATRFSVTLPPEVATMVDVHTVGERDRSASITRALGRYYSLLTRARRGLKAKLLPQEIELCLGVLKGAALPNWATLGTLPGQINHAILFDGLAEHYEIDGKALIDKMLALTDAEILALAEAAERYWAHVAAGDHPQVAWAFDDPHVYGK